MEHPFGRLRVALVYPDVHRAGGIERYVREVSRRLARDHDVTIVSGDGDTVAGCRALSASSLVGVGFLRAFFFALSATRVLRAQNFDIVNAQGASTLAQDVVTAHSCHRAWFVRSLANLRPLSLAWFLKLLNPAHYLTLLVEAVQYRSSRLARVVAVSRSVRADLVKYYGLPADRIDVVYDGVDARAFDCAGSEGGRDAFRRELGIRTGEMVILFVANEFKRKGLETLIRALPRLSKATPARVVVVGEDSAAPYRRLARRLEVERLVSFQGPVDDPRPYYQAADLLALPTRYEPFGLVVAEAMASCIPVVVSRAAGVAELLEHGRSAWLLEDPYDADELVGALAALANPDRRTEMAAAGHAVACELTWECVVEGLLDAYHEVLHAAGRGEKRGVG